MLVVPIALGGLWAGAQQTPSSQEQVPVLRKEIRLVLVDVVVTDKKGKPVRGLTKDDFALKEDSKPEEIAVFEWEGPTEEPRPSPPPLPENVYTNRPEYHPPPGPLTIVLLDAVNTPQTDQVRMREEILQYLDSHFTSGQRTAILALTDRLLVLQDFTADRDLLMAAVKKYTPKGSVLLGIRESMTSREEDQRRDLLRDVGSEYGAGDPALKALIEDILQAEENFLAMTDKARMERTLAGLRALAQAVVGYPGRKNLIWVSAAFPSMYAGDPYGRQQWSMGGEMRRTAQLLQDARVAIYPVDPRGVKPAFKPESYREFKDRMDRAGRPKAFGGNPKASVPTASVRHPQYNLVTSQMSMKTIADTTGGLAFYNRNDISNAVALALADGAAYYTLGYYPANKELDGKFRRIQVKLARKGLRLRYRKGYYATEMPEAAEEAENKDGKVPEGKGESGPEQRNARQLRAALYHPLPATGLTFRAYVSPPEAAARAQVQEEIIKVEFWLEGGGLTFQPQGEGRQRIDLDFVLAAFTPQGVQVNNVAQRFRRSLTPAEYQQALKTGMNYPMSIELEPGSYQLRLLVRDNPSGRLGRVDAPLRVAAPQTAVAH